MNRQWRRGRQGNLKKVYAAAMAGSDLPFRRFDGHNWYQLRTPNLSAAEISPAAYHFTIAWEIHAERFAHHGSQISCGNRHDRFALRRRLR
jgi:hypothetical protein